MIPALSLLVLSTASRYAQIHIEIHHLLDAPGTPSDNLLKFLLVRAGMFRNALVSLYVSISLLTLAGLAGGIASMGDADWVGVVIALSVIAAIFLIYAAAQLIREAILSLVMMKEHEKELRGRQKV